MGLPKGSSLTPLESFELNSQQMVLWPQAYLIARDKLIQSTPIQALFVLYSICTKVQKERQT